MGSGLGGKFKLNLDLSLFALQKTYSDFESAWMKVSDDVIHPIPIPPRCSRHQHKQRAAANMRARPIRHGRSDHRERWNSKHSAERRWK
ncbi:hypothetical protein AVEN_29714-1 [Araneus ventricosus]|uniref:Uncharacterized protein n=1 Tax=Araneus ventricosus TaxID=182803 RepID=A0A4Y2NX62_ARAVE|nr:hypothetical protein AVEN_29714-1 [Araneus ventricosus]